MDPTEDLSARVLLRHILSTETPRTPITRSASREQRTSGTGTRRSSRLKKDAQTPQNILRRSLKNKLHESVTRKSLPATKRRTASAALRKVNTPASVSGLFDDGDTPRHILMNILRTEPARSPVVHEEAAPEEPQPSSANASIASKHTGMELSDLELPDLTIRDVMSPRKGLSRKRPRWDFNVSASEKRLKEAAGVGEDKKEESVDNLSSLSVSNFSTLSLKTPVVEVEKRVLWRKPPNRRRLTVEECLAAAERRPRRGPSNFEPAEPGLSDTTSDDFTFGLTKLGDPDATTDVAHCNTALYAQPDATTDKFYVVATQDKSTVMASQLQRQLSEAEQPEEPSELEKRKSLYLFPTEEAAVEEPEVGEDVDAAESQTEKGERAAEFQPEDAAAVSKSEGSQTSVKDDKAQSEEEGNREEAQREDASQTEGDAATRSRSEEEEEEEEEEKVEEVAPELQIKEEDGVDSHAEEDVAAASQSEEEEAVPDSQDEEEEEDGVDSHAEEDAAAGSQSEEEEDVAEYQSDQEGPSEGGPTDSQPEDEHDGEPEEEAGEQESEQLEGDVEHISRRAHRSEGGLIVPVTEAGGDSTDATETGWSDGKSKAHSSLDAGSHESGPLHTGLPDLAESLTQSQTDASSAEPNADKENSFHVPEEMSDTEDNGHLSDEEPAAQDSSEPEEESEDDEDHEESEQVPSKTPAFVREKRRFFHPYPLQMASTSVLNNGQASSTSEDLPAPKPKQVRKRRSGPTKKEGGLPKSYLMSVFKHFAEANVSADVYPILQETMEKFLGRMAEDLEAYALHAKRKTIEVEDAELLLRRQGHVNDKVPVEVLIEKYLRMDQRRLLIPIATSGNVVIPKKKR